MFKQGETIELKTNVQTFQGVFIKEEKDFVVLKLGNGYNIGVSKRTIKEQKSIAKPKPVKEEVKKEKQDKKLPSITILHTGGTIASKVDYSTGAVIAKFTESDILKLFPEIKELANIKSELVRNMQSEMMRFAHYNILAKAIKKEAEKGADGIIITHGTDTLHNTSAALSFAVENLGIPVMLVGSQRSSDRGSSDSAINLLAATQFIVNSDFAGVAICMHENPNDDTCLILPACKTRKMHTSRRDAFRPINALPIARVFVEKKKIDFISEHDKKDKKKKIELKLFNEKLKVGLVASHVQMFASELLAYKDFDGLVIELLGIGHMPTMKVDEFTAENDKILLAIQELAKKMPVVVAPLPIYGRVNMNVYTPGKQLIEAGVIGNYTDMTPETAFIKLAWLLSNYKDKKEIAELFEKNLHGEISDRSEKEFFLI
ncbi:MAG: Glu-tRNA(Gln) amidotransferase subunit GatD [Nanoarchaeota archaeon]|nr:Glu-tRNA(Gln) amidotransferase subunit GatD [Nanoarchaeota archaeon]MBU1321186.1 Glu-tRNA(Gln) amidotransferase subunit GatD [Nanoarchaeota archaeon]MBU1598312.1 Glu-tRNA(Gln) amidotransferase subunit GatD [Nanoarchaeota archaeon]MBU2441112.1 Glu-tRNA(Gln) amidotransferase subunit GatD [Nanoarchaeota archaeon]